MTGQLRPYQRKVVSELSAHYKAGVQGVALVMPTGSGKTRTATFVVDKYASTGRQVLWIVHREELLMQSAMTFAENGIEHRMICAASSERAIKVQQFRELGRSFVNQRSHVIIASIQTIVRRLDKLDWLQPSQIVADECHLSLAATWRRVLGNWPDARLLGLTATLKRLDAQSFDRKDGGLYDEVVIGPPVAELIDSGALATYKAYAPPINFVATKIGKKGGDWDSKDLEKELDAPVIYGDVVSHYTKLSHGKPAIAFCPTVASAERFAQAFRDAGYRAIALDGTTDDAIRRKALQQLGTGELDVVTSVSILVEGTDVPFATTAILLRRTQSLTLYLQAVGRVLRPHPEKEHAIILDFVGVTAIHGFPDDPREWSLDGESKRKGRAANDNVPDVNITTCPMCFTIHEAAPVCPGCGHQYQPGAGRKEMKQVDGELREVTAAEKQARQRQAEVEKQKARKQRISQEHHCQSLEDLIELGKSRNYSYPKAWAEKRWQFIESSRKQRTG